MSNCNDYPVNNIDAEVQTCIDCGAPITKQSKTGRCFRCAHEARRTIFSDSRCIVNGCDKPAKARGLCSGHLHKLYRYGKADLPNKRAQDGRTTHPLYSTWQGIKDRCYNRNNAQFNDYGGRGVVVCERWLMPLEGFWNFVHDMGERPDGYSLDRIDPNGDYCPENCQWADRLTQNNNTRRTAAAMQMAIKHPDMVEIYPAIVISTPDGDRTIKFNSLNEMLERLERINYNV